MRRSSGITERPNYFRVDWLTPNGLVTWGDGRTIILGTDGLSNCANTSTSPGTRRRPALPGQPRGRAPYVPSAGRSASRIFGELILDCLNRTEIAMTQEHAFKAAELCIAAQNMAVRL